MKLSKRFLLLASLLVSLAGLVLIYIAAISLEPKQITISDITAEMEGRKVSTTGHLVEKREHKDGHLFLTIEDNKTKIQVPLFSDLMKKLNDVGITKNDFTLGSTISVEGTLESYKGNLQIVPRKLDDVKILGV